MKDEQTRFNLAVECGNIEVALQSAQVRSGHRLVPMLIYVDHTELWLCSCTWIILSCCYAHIRGSYRVVAMLIYVDLRAPAPAPQAFKP